MPEEKGKKRREYLWRLRGASWEASIFVRDEIFAGWPAERLSSLMHGPHLQLMKTIFSRQLPVWCFDPGATLRFPAACC